MLLLMLAGMLLRGWRQLPYVGFIVAPVVQYLSIRYMVGQQAAAIGFSLLAALLPAWERPLMNFLELWAASRVLAASSMKPFFDRCVPRSKRKSFIQ
jgi:hypothetical protein